PTGGLALSSDGNLYGTCNQGGISNWGTVYMITPGGTFSSIRQFALTDGWHPTDSMFLGSDGNLYGTASSNGNGTVNGTVFKFQTEGSHNLVVLQNSSTGQVALWSVSKKTVIDAAIVSSIPPAGWNVVG